jgi:hypothetical protein
MLPLRWCRVDYAEYPPEDEFVWTSDQVTVQQGRWTFPGPGIPLEEGKWEDLHGQPITVTDWKFLGESPDGPPQPPAPHPICRGGIVGFQVLEDWKRTDEKP